MSSASGVFHPPRTPRELMLTWLRRARDSQMSHYAMANLLGRRDRALGVPVILISTLVGTSVFGSIAAATIPLQAKVVVGLLSLAAGLLSSLQTFFRFSERAEKHRLYGARFGAVRREIEALVAEGSPAAEPRYIDVLREKLDRLAVEAPHVPTRVFERARCMIEPGEPAAGASTPAR
jgi:hypothetical protein